MKSGVVTTQMHCLLNYLINKHMEMRSCLIIRRKKKKSSVGFISAIHGKFCGSCNRVRLTSRGFLKLCLCYENGVDLREVLQNGTAADLRDVMAQAILKKPMEHCFERPKDMTELHLMSGIGG